MNKWSARIYRLFPLPAAVLVLFFSCAGLRSMGTRLPGFRGGEEANGEGAVAVERSRVRDETYQHFEKSLRLYHRGRTLYRYGQMQSARDQLERAMDLLALLDLSESEHPDLLGRRDQLMERAGELRSWIDDRIEAMALSDVEIYESRPSLPPGESPEITYDIPLVYNARVQAFIDLYCGPAKDIFELHLARGGKYEEIMRRILVEEGVPTDLVYVCLIESGYNPKAYSWAHAAGPWQFILSTGQIFELKTDWWVDERRDPEKSTRAAARYLKSLYQRFGSWPLALAAYNSGARRVRGAMRRAGTDDFWELNLPRQTNRYVPKYMASMMIAKRPEAFGFHIDYHAPDEVDIVSIPQCTDLKLIAKCANTTYEQIKELNPELRRWCTPPDVEGYRLRLPKGHANDFRANYNSIPKKQLVTLGRYRVKRGDTLSGIADTFGTTVAAVASANRLNSRHLIQPGQELVIPGQGSISVLAENRGTLVSGSEPAPGQPELERGEGRMVEYTVKRRDTLYDIARQHGTTIARLRSWNRIDPGDLIRPGDRLTIFVADSTPETGFRGSDADEGSDEVTGISTGN